MEANRTPRWARVWACTSIVVAGCTLYDRPPAARQEEAPPSESDQPAQVVQDEPGAEPDLPEDEVARSVLAYIDRIDDTQRRVHRPPVRPSYDTGHLRQAADTDPQPTSKPVGHNRITVIRESATEVPASAPSTQPSASQAPTTAQSSLEPPVLADVVVRAAPDFVIQAGEPHSSAANARAVARSAPASLHEFLEQMLPPEQASFREQLDLRLLWAIAGDYERAGEPLTMVSAEQQELAARFVDTRIALREGHMGDLAGAASAAAEQLAQLQESLCRLGDLSVPVLQICSAVRGFGQYDAVEPARFLAGSPGEFVLYCEVRGFASEQRNDGCHYTTFDMTSTILNRGGDTVLQITDTDITDRCRNRRHDCFIPRLVRLPATLSPGGYVAKVTLIDKLGQKVAENRAAFEVVARP